MRLRGVRQQLLFATAVLTLGGVILWGLQKATADVSFDALVMALRATRTSALLIALTATVVSYGALVGYDLSGLRYAGARLPLRTVLLASFCGYAIGNAVGLGAFSGGAVRYRIYTAAGLVPGQIARLIGFISVALGIGLAAIAGLGLILRVDQVSRMLGTSRAPLLTTAATILFLATIFLIFCATRRRPVVLGPVAIQPPGPVLVLTQMTLTMIDVLAAAVVLWALLPPTGIGFFAFAAVYAAALALGVLSHVPGGLGVFEIAILYAVGSKAPVSHVAAALVAYRTIYYLLPLFLSTVLLAGFEARRSLGGEVGGRINRAATRLAPSFLAAATFAVGATLVVSGAMPAFIERLQNSARPCAALVGRDLASARQCRRAHSSLCRARAPASSRWRVVAGIVDGLAQHSVLARQRADHHRTDSSDGAADRADRGARAIRPPRVLVVATIDRGLAGCHRQRCHRDDLDPVLRVPRRRLRGPAVVAI